eukprot:10976885-Alexandrium_andersonii.AAC.1
MLMQSPNNKHCPTHAQGMDLRITSRDPPIVPCVWAGRVRLFGYAFQPARAHHRASASVPFDGAFFGAMFSMMTG